MRSEASLQVRTGGNAAGCGPPRFAAGLKARNVEGGDPDGHDR